MINHFPLCNWLLSSLYIKWLRKLDLNIWLFFHEWVWSSVGRTFIHCHDHSKLFSFPILYYNKRTIDHSCALGFKCFLNRQRWSMALRQLNVLDCFKVFVKSKFISIFTWIKYRNLCWKLTLVMFLCNCILVLEAEIKVYIWVEFEGDFYILSHYKLN